MPKDMFVEQPDTNNNIYKTQFLMQEISFLIHSFCTALAALIPPIYEITSPCMHNIYY